MVDYRMEPAVDLHLVKTGLATHQVLALCICTRARNIQARYLKNPKALPVQEKATRGKARNEDAEDLDLGQDERASVEQASARLTVPWVEAERHTMRITGSYDEHAGGVPRVPVRP